VEKGGQVRGHGPELQRCQEKAPDACRLRRLKKGNRADELVPVCRPVQPDRVKVVHLRCKNVAQAGVNQASDRQGLTEQAVQQEQGNQHPSQLLRARPRSARSSVVSRPDVPVRSNVHGKVSLHKIRHRVPINRYGSGRRPQWEQPSVANLVELHNNQARVNSSRLRLAEDSRMKRVCNEKECRGLVVSRLRHNSNSAHSPSRDSKGARRLQRNSNRAANSRKADKEGNQKKRHRQGSNKILAHTPAGFLFRPNSRCSVRCRQRSR
jgi:hypothetical protein